MIARLRTWLFQAVFYGGSVPLVLVTPFTALAGRRVLVANVHLWCRFHRLACALILGIRPRTIGTPPAGQYLYAAKHHAMYETLELVLMLGDPVVVIKQELTRIPIWGWAIQRYGAIVVDRDASATALRALMQQAKAAREEGRSVLIFPEGTRVPAGEKPPLKSGFAGLYRAFGMPVVAIAIDSGVNWPKGKPKRAGVVTFDFAAPIPPGQGREAIEAAVHEAVNRLD